MNELVLIDSTAFAVFHIVKDKQRLKLYLSVPSNASVDIAVLTVDESSDSTGFSLKAPKRSLHYIRLPQAVPTELQQEEEIGSEPKAVRDKERSDY